MPIYEYRCEHCGRLSTFLVFKGDFLPICKHCGGKNLTKLISRVTFLRSDEDRLERLAEPSQFGGIDERDPRSIARWMKRMGRELGEDLGEEIDQIVEEARDEEGEAPEELL